MFTISTKVKISLNYKINQEITSQQVRLVAEDGSALGIVSLAEALAEAAKQEMDLVEISPQATPTVCKMMNYSKMRYSLQKKEIENRKKTKRTSLKEIRFGAHIAEHDYQVKLNHVKRFLQDGDKVKISMILRGRQNAHKDLAVAMFGTLKIDLEECAKVDSDVSVAGNFLTMTVSPKKV